MWGVKNFLDRIDGMLDVWELGHSDFGRYYWS